MTRPAYKYQYPVWANVGAKVFFNFKKNHNVDFCKLDVFFLKVCTYLPNKYTY